MTDISLTLPIWYLPLLFTAVAYWQAFKSPVIYFLPFRLALATIASLSAWLAWSILT